MTLMKRGRSLFSISGILTQTSFHHHGLLKCELASLFSSNQYVDFTKGKYLGFPNNWQTEFAWE